MRLLITIFLLFTSHTFLGQVIKITSTLRNTRTLKMSGSSTGGRFVFRGSIFDTITGDYYLSSIAGNNGYNGTTRLLAKGTIRSIDTIVDASSLQPLTIAIEKGSVMQGIEGITAARGNIFLKPYSNGTSGMPKFIGTTVHNTGWTLTGTNTYQKSIANTITLTYGSYAFLYVIEIDTLLERTQPLTARRYLRYKPNTTAVDTVAGTYYCPDGTGGVNALISIHTSDGVSPNNHPHYRYEVVTKDGVFDRALNEGLNATSVSGLFGLDYGRGTGAFSSRRDSFSLTNSVVMGNAIHQLSTGNSSFVNKCAFIGGDPNINGASVVFYQTAGLHETNILQNSIFLDQPTVLYTHTGAAGNHGRLLFKDSYVYNSSINVASSANCDTLEVDGCYMDSVVCVVNGSNANQVYIKNSVINKGTTILTLTTENISITNCLFKSKEYSITGTLNTSRGKITLTNNIFHYKCRTPISGEGGTIINVSDTAARVTSKHNVFVLETATGGATKYSFGGTGSQLTYDSNAYILVSGIPVWLLNGGYIFNFADWKTASGQDAHSIFLDITSYGVDALARIFVDAPNGNYNFANTPQADSVQAILAGMTTPPARFKTTPSRESIVNEVQNDAFISPRNRLY